MRCESVSLEDARETGAHSAVMWLLVLLAHWLSWGFVDTLYGAVSGTDGQAVSTADQLWAHST
jgi:hypothetical protein